MVDKRIKALGLSIDTRFLQLMGAIDAITLNGG